MAKITRLSESANVTTVVGITEPDDPNRVEYLEPEVDEDGFEAELEDDGDLADSGDPDLMVRLEATGEAEVTPGEPVPDGSIAEVQAWVGDDWVKAERALDAERAGKNRSGLVSWLEKVVSAK